MKAVETDAGSLDGLNVPDGNRIQILYTLEGCPLDLLQVSTVYPRQLAWLSEPTIRD